MNLNELKKERQIVNLIDWSMTPEKAIDMYLEWGAGWSRGNEFVSGPNDESIYFVLYDFESPPQVTLVRRNMREAIEIAKVDVPRDLFLQAWEEDGNRPGVGVHRLNKELLNWVIEALEASANEPYPGNN